MLLRVSPRLPLSVALGLSLVIDQLVFIVVSLLAVPLTIYLSAVILESLAVAIFLGCTDFGCSLVLPAKTYVSVLL